MKFECEKNLLEKAISKIEQIIPSREGRSIYANILVSVGKDEIYFTSSDMENTVRIKLSAKNTTAGEVLVNGRKFSEISKKISSDDFIFETVEKENFSETEGSLVKISGSSKNSARYEITTTSAEGFPSITLYNQDFLTEIDANTLREMIQKTIYSVSQEDNRYIFNGLCFIFQEDNLTLVGTDGRRLSAITRKLLSPVRFVHEGDIVVHQRALREILRLLEDGETAYLSVEQREFYFSCGGAEMKSRLLEGRFPDYKKVIPGQSAIEFFIEREDLAQALSQVVVMAQPPSYSTNLTIEKGKITLSCKNPEGGNAHIIREIPNLEGNLEIGFNGQFLQDVLKNLETDQIQLGFTDPSKPIVIKDKNDPDFISLVMPLKQ